MCRFSYEKSYDKFDPLGWTLNISQFQRKIIRRRNRRLSVFNPEGISLATGSKTFKSSQIFDHPEPSLFLTEKSNQGVINQDHRSVRSNFFLIEKKLFSLKMKLERFTIFEFPDENISKNQKTAFLGREFRNYNQNFDQAPIFGPRSKFHPWMWFSESLISKIVSDFRCDFDLSTKIWISHLKWAKRVQLERIKNLMKFLKSLLFYSLFDFSKKFILPVSWVNVEFGAPVDVESKIWVYIRN